GAAPASTFPPTAEAISGSRERRTNVPSFAAHRPLMWRIHARTSSGPCTDCSRERSAAKITGRSAPLTKVSIAELRWYNCFGANQHHRGLGPNDAQPVEDFQPGGLRHPEVQEGHFERLAVHRLQGGGAIGRGHDLMPIFAEEPREFVSKRRVVVRDEDLHSA